MVPHTMIPVAGRPSPHAHLRKLQALRDKIRVAEVGLDMMQDDGAVSLKIQADVAEQIRVLREVHHTVHKAFLARTA